MSLGILKINEKRILGLTDPVALFQFLKELARHTYDIEALFQVMSESVFLCMCVCSVVIQAAYVDLNPFPSRSHLSSRHQHHFSTVREQWADRERQRAKNEQINTQVHCVCVCVCVCVFVCDTILHRINLETLPPM